MDSKVAFITGLLFVALPVHTEAVAYILPDGPDTMAAFLALISFLFYIGFLENKKGSALKGLASFVSLLVAAIWSKEIAAVTPFLFFLYEISFRKHQKYQKHYPICNGIATFSCGIDCHVFFYQASCPSF